MSRRNRKKRRIRLRETDILSLPNFREPTTVTFVGTKGQGKSTICRRLWACFNRMMYRKYGKFPFNFALCGSAKLKAEWGYYVGRLYAHNEDSSHDKLAEIIEKRQEQIGPHLEEFIEDGGNPEDFVTPPEYFSVGFLDDMGSDYPFMRCKEMKKIANESRHIGIYAFVMIQYLKQVSPELRGGTDILVLLEMSNKKELTSIYEEFLTGVDITFKEFTALARQCIEGKGNGIVIYKRADTYKIEDRLFFYSHNVHDKPFKSFEDQDTGEEIVLCAKQLDYSRRHYVSDKARRKAVSLRKQGYRDFNLDEEQSDILTNITMNDVDPRRLSKFVGENYEDEHIQLVKLPGIKEKLKYD